MPLNLSALLYCNTLDLCNITALHCTVSLYHCHLTRKRPLLGRDSFDWEQREILGLVLEWFEQEQGLGPAWQTQSRERAERGSWSLYLLSSTRNWIKIKEK